MSKKRRGFGSITLTRASVGAVALFVLMGAKGEGCFNGGGPGEDDDSIYPDPPTELCPPGHHVELVCGGCGDDGPYPADPGEPQPGWEGQGEGAYGPVPPPPDAECEEICVPDDACPEGTYEEVVCQGWGGGAPDPMTPCLDPNGCQEPPPPPVEECYSICVPLSSCGPGEVEVWVCDEGQQGGGGGGICLDPQGCQEPPPPEPGDCYPVCMPGDPMCPPGMEPEIYCDQWGCWEECIGYPEPGEEPPPDPGMQP